MPATTTSRPVETFRLRRFSPAHASEIARWVATPLELHRLAPGTSFPLTPAKVIGWKKPNGTALVVTGPEADEPIGYAELNPMKNGARECWLGHVVLHPQRRGVGIGTRFVRALISYAFERLSVRQIVLVVFPHNTAALRCYRRNGFRHVADEYHRFGTDPKRHRMLRFQLDRDDGLCDVVGSAAHGFGRGGQGSRR